MSLSREGKRERQAKAILRAQRRLKTRLEDIDWEEEILFPIIEAIKAGKTVLGLPEASTFDIQIEQVHADSDSQPKADDQ